MLIRDSNLSRNAGEIYNGISWNLNIFLSHISFELKKENGELVSFNGQVIAFRLSIKEVWK